MAVKEDNDICLNIVTGIASPKKQSPKITSDVRIKRLNTNPGDGTRKPFQKFQSIESSKSLLVGAKKRIKQKSLASIVANNLKRVDQSAEPPKTSILKKLVAGNKKVSGSNAKDTKSEKDKRVSFSQNKNDASRETLVQFTKPTKENALKTILAKKRKNDTGEPKKSLSSIFKTSSSTDSNLLEQNVAKDKTDIQFINEKQQANATRSNAASIKCDGNPIKKFKKSRDKEEKFNKNKRDIKETSERPRPQQGSGKISSLFGHNPTIPNIGQRFVKPVNEKVFSAEKFGDLGIHAFSVQNLEQNMKITTMTTVQKKAIPVVLSGRDVLVRSQTGSGKTLAYALPIVESLQCVRPKLTRDSGIKALVVVPTRELALQTYECFLKLIKPFTWIVPGYLVGGEKRKAEKARLRKGCTILIATPGRLLDHIKHTKALRLDLINCFVLDEADRMLDMGYEKDISEIVAALENNSSTSDNSGYNPMQMLRQRINPEAIDQNKSEENGDKVIASNQEDHSDEERRIITKQEYNSDSEEDPDNEVDLKESAASSNLEENKSDDNRQHKRQTILLSATLTQAVEKLAGLTMHNPAFVDAAKENVEAVGGNLSEINDDLVVPESVAQSYIVTPPKLRMVTLSAYIAGRCQSQGSHKILVFMATQDMIDYHAEVLSTVLNKPIDEEDEDSEPLVDVEFFKLHGSMTQKERTEIFKTFRAAKSGVLLCTDVAARGLDLPKVDTVVQYTGPTSTRDYVHRIGRTARAGTSGTATIFLTPPEVEFARMLEKHRIRIKQEDMDDVLAKLLGPLSPHNSVHAAAIALQNDFENLVLENKKLYTAACKAYTSWVRFYSSYPREMREVFNRKDLHLGHYAKSFALREPPQKIGAAGKSIREREQSQLAKPKHQNRLSNQRNDGVPGNNKRRAGQGGVGGGGGGASQRQQDRRSGMLKNVRMLNTSEYDSGLEPIKKPKKS